MPAWKSTQRRRNLLGQIGRHHANLLKITRRVIRQSLPGLSTPDTSGGNPSCAPHLRGGCEPPFAGNPHRPRARPPCNHEQMLCAPGGNREIAGLQTRITAV